MEWRIHHSRKTASTNLDARAGSPGDVYTADCQTAGRGRLDHRWLSPPGVNLLMSVVLSVEWLSPEHVSTLPLVVGLAVCCAIRKINPRGESELTLSLKWPNDVLIGGKKVAGILCERIDERVIVGIGVNVHRQHFPPEIAESACFLGDVAIEQVRDAVLSELSRVYEVWRKDGFESLYRDIQEIDFLKGRYLSVWQTDDDVQPLRGICGGIREDGALQVANQQVYAGEAHIERVKR